MATDEKLSEVVSLRFTPREMERLRALAGGKKLSQVVRDLALQALNDETANRHPVVATRTEAQPVHSIVMMSAVESSRGPAAVTYFDANLTTSR